jgi:hypothetical protein
MRLVFNTTIGYLFIVPHPLLIATRNRHELEVMLPANGSSQRPLPISSIKKGLLINSINRRLPVRVIFLIFRQVLP